MSAPVTTPYQFRRVFKDTIQSLCKKHGLTPFTVFEFSVRQVIKEIPTGPGTSTPVPDIGEWQSQGIRSECARCLFIFGLDITYLKEPKKPKPKEVKQPRSKLLKRLFIPSSAED